MILVLISHAQLHEHRFSDFSSMAGSGQGLKIRVLVPFELARGGQMFGFEAYVPDFGGPNGTITTNLNRALNRSMLEVSFFSTLSEEYRVYNRHFPCGRRQVEYAKQMRLGEGV
jgi:hypothetical protein